MAKQPKKSGTPPAAAKQASNAEAPDAATAVTQALEQAQQGLDEVKAAADADTPAPGSTAPGGAGEATPLRVPNFAPDGDAAALSSIDLLGDVELHVTVELGRTQMLVEDVLKLGPGSVVELEKLAGDPVDVYVNKRLVARGEVLVLSDNFCIRISEIVEDLEEQARAAAAQESHAN